MSDSNHFKFVDQQLDPVIYGPLGRIGYVPEIWGPEGQLCEGFRPTRHELGIVYLYWARRQIEIHVDWFLDASVSSSEMRLDAYCGRRCSAIGEALGEAECARLDKLAKEAVRRSCNEETWRMYVEKDYAARDRMMQAAFDRSGDRAQ